MSSLNEFLKTDDLNLTLTNEQGEILTVGAADYVKPLKSKTIVKWNVAAKYHNTFPFTIAVLHGAKKVFDVIFIKAVLPSTETVVQMEY
jgi:hypothetical protein